MEKKMDYIKYFQPFSKITGAMFIITCLMGLTVLSNCQQDHSSPTKRLKKFIEILTQEEAKLFSAGNKTKLVQKINERLDQDQDFQKKWLQIKKKEAILLFSTQQVVEFFYRHFYLPHQKKSEKKS